MAASKRAGSSAQVSLWVLVGALGAGGVGLFVYGVTQPEPRRNLADAMPIANLAPKAKKRIRRSEPSVRRKLAEARNEEKRTECQWRHDDCTIACDQYPDRSSGRRACMSFCDRARTSCLTWAHN